ncbi:MAG: tetratricopeptide repeat protein [Rhodospirillaceae bacterium]
MQNNIKTRRLEAGDIPGAIAILKELLVFAPQESAFWREMGMMQLRMGALGDAVDSLEGYLRVDPDANDRDRIYQVVRRLRERLT